MEDFRTGTVDLGWRLETEQYNGGEGISDIRDQRSGGKRKTLKSQKLKVERQEINAETQSSQRRGETGKLVAEVWGSLTPEGVSYRWMGRYRDGMGGWGTQGRGAGVTDMGGGRKGR
jgi:hypothetical protein